jgi:F0F1-type ATP synthase membrane subunit b/b'
MSDFDMMAENIENAMQAVEEAHRASARLREQANEENLKAFRAKLIELEEHLALMKQILEHEVEYSIDEVIDALVHTLGQSESYHRIPHYALESEKKVKG